ncbi:hypothetical protein PIB30_035287 [Stylosanthes scabra]|uniref:Uncharacterized protein n=1 Tax=Stylosanthes scabra TaxID=79078 RepID=A0ABU6YBW8_9FABA|nr:hypothetical protein [Stylosanthes scabra]
MSLSPMFMKSLRKQVMELYYSCNQGYTPWNPTPYQPHDLGYNAHQSNGFGDAYYGYEDPSPPYPPSQNEIHELFLATLVFEHLNNSSNISQPSNSEDLPSKPLSNPWRHIGSFFLCTNQERREDVLNEEDVESLHESLEEVEEGNEAQVAKDVDQKLQSEFQFEWVNLPTLNFTDPQHYALLETDDQLRALDGVLNKKEKESLQLNASKSITCWESEFKTYSEYLHKLHNNRAKVGTLIFWKHLGPWQFQEKLGGTNQVWDTGKSLKNHHFWGVIACVGVFRDLLSMNWDPLEPIKFKHWWGFKDEFKHKPP